MITVVRDPATLRAQVAAWRRAGERVALVPTMGALHRGHMALVDAARGMAERIVLSIFVNPTQFAPSEDFSAYPRTFEADRALFDDAGGGCIYAPTLEAMYAQGFSTTITPGGPALAGLEDAFRPMHFAGVATIVAKLLTQCAPDFAMFGEKDFQQLRVVTCVAADLDLPVRICGVPTLRDADGLALSSRATSTSRRMNARGRRNCIACWKILRRPPWRAARWTMRSVRRARRSSKLGFAVDYVEVRDAETLAGARAGEHASARSSGGAARADAAHR